ncbi:TonB-dependent siderophore receptor [Xylophilus sp. Leaf220]|uniref:TonB-dependent receptor n=1 Tax=Xylophilus sp. Leaf220 TaxID=1735686 RepID=UPI0007001C80|nr:TonB-dependent siderophore receptor [Xylophilus sp. Leaf220]KQM75207.1 hypothetical protein ASE76_19095 [Xylophilus sp. Leaf220]
MKTSLPLLAAGALLGAPFLSLSLAARAQSSLPEVRVSGSADAPGADVRPRSVSTATRTDTPAKEIPQSIESVSVDKALDYGQTTLGAALTGVPGIDNAADTRFDGLVVRGFSGSGDLFLDGIRDDAQYVRDLTTIDRIEVLKGPAAVLYGRGSGGGVVNRISKQPRADAFGRVDLRAGSYGLRGGTVDINRPVSERWSARISASAEDADSFRNGVSGQRRALAPSLRWDDGQGSSWLLQYNYSLYDRTPDRGIPSVRTAPAAGSPAGTLSGYALPTGVNIANTYGDPARDFIRDEVQSVRSTWTHAFDGDWSLRYTLGYIALHSTFDNTYPTDSLRNARTRAVAVSRQRWTQDLHQRNLLNTVELTGRRTLAGMRHQLLVGVEAGAQARDSLLRNAAAPSVDLAAPDLVAGRSVAALANNADNRHRVNTRAAYIQDQIDLAAQWKLLVGARYDHFEIDSSSRLTGRQEARSSSSVSPRIGVVWTPVPAHSVYASWTKNFAPVGGGLIGITPGASGNDLDPEFTRQVETGVKSDWLDGALSSTVALYQLELYNRRTTDPVDPGKVILTGLQRSRGLEAGLSGRLAPQWFVRGGMAFQDAEVVRAEPRYTGKRPTNTSPRNGSVFLSYAPRQGLYADGGVVYVGERYADRDNLVRLPGYARVDALVGYRFGPTELQMAISNLTDRRYWATATSAAQIVPGTPRTVLVSLRHHF